jgi:hypothetical protein
MKRDENNNNEKMKIKDKKKTEWKVLLWKNAQLPSHPVKIM